jgi:3-deoxy-manno-octulosonate cytidylyltransferase (CMP-KDO synthetase)
MTSASHASGSDRLAEACTLLGMPDDAVVVNVQGDEPLIDSALMDAVAQLLADRPDCAMSTAAHAIDNLADYLSPHVVKVVLDARQTALYFSRAPIPFGRDLTADDFPKHPAPLRHVGIYGYRAGFLKSFPGLRSAPVEQLECLEQLRVLWHGYRIAVHETEHSPGIGVDTPADLAAVRRFFTSPP